MSECDIESQYAQVRSIAGELQVEVTDDEIDALVSKFNSLVEIVQGTGHESNLPDQETFFKKEIGRDKERKESILREMAVIKRLLPKAEALYLRIKPEADNFYYYEDYSFEATERCVKYFENISEGATIKIFLENMIARFELIIERFNPEKLPIIGIYCVYLHVKDAQDEDEMYYVERRIASVSKRGYIKLKGIGGTRLPSEIFPSAPQALKEYPVLNIIKREDK